MLRIIKRNHWHFSQNFALHSFSGLYLATRQKKYNVLDTHGFRGQTLKTSRRVAAQSYILPVINFLLILTLGRFKGEDWTNASDCDGQI